MHICACTHTCTHTPPSAVEVQTVQMFNVLIKMDEYTHTIKATVICKTLCYRNSITFES